MDLGIISVRYATALLKFSNENKEAKKVYEEMCSLQQSFLLIPQMQEVLKSPVLSKEEYKVLIETASLMPKSKISNSFSKFIDLLIDENRRELIIFISASFQDLYLKTNGIIKGELILPCKLANNIITKEINKLIEKRSNYKVELEVKIDKSIEGGFILTYGTYQLDLSLKAQMKNIKRQLLV